MNRLHIRLGTWTITLCMFFVLSGISAMAKPQATTTDDQAPRQPPRRKRRKRRQRPMPPRRTIRPPPAILRPPPAKKSKKSKKAAAAASSDTSAATGDTTAKKTSKKSKKLPRRCRSCQLRHFGDSQRHRDQEDRKKARKPTRQRRAAALRCDSGQHAPATETHRCPDQEDSQEQEVGDRIQAPTAGTPQLPQPQLPRQLHTPRLRRPAPWRLRLNGCPVEFDGACPAAKARSSKDCQGTPTPALPIRRLRRPSRAAWCGSTPIAASTTKVGAGTAKPRPENS